MNLQWFTSPGWAHIVQTLLHTLWQGAVIAVLLGLALRRLDNPVMRYRSSLAALAGVLLAGLVTWAVLNRPMTRPLTNPSVPAAATAAAVEAAPQNNTALPAAPRFVGGLPPEPAPVAPGWTAWLALVWLAGATLMIGRAGFQVAGAERLRRATQPLMDERIVQLLAEARQAVGLARRVRLAVTDRLTSPAVVGVLVPTLILPLSLTTTMTPEQIRFILLHELAHIRRGDYFANLFQLFAEALLFFNPAVWWISRHMRLEREACCDALAIELSGAPADYARTLLCVAENILTTVPAAAPAFGDQREPSSLTDRVQRMLVPGYRPRLRLTWQAMLAALCLGGALLTLSAIGTRVTVAAILSPQQRIERIEKKMIEMGERPEAPADGTGVANTDDVKITGTVRMADGSPVPKWVQVDINSSFGHSSYGTADMAKAGKFTNIVRAGTIYLSAEVTNFAPVMLGPLDGFATNLFENEELVMERGFDVRLRVLDAESGTSLPGAIVSTLFRMNNHSSQMQFWKSDGEGMITVSHCADMPLEVQVNAPGHEIFKQQFSHFHAGETLELRLQRGGVLAGTVRDRVTGEPLAGATFHLLYQSTGAVAGNYDWDDTLHRLGQSDAGGAFSLDQLRSGVRYYVGISAPGHESVRLENIAAGATNLEVRLGPELIVHGHVRGDLESLERVNKKRVLYVTITDRYQNNSDSRGGWVTVEVTNGAATFTFTNRVAGPVTLSGTGYHEERLVSAPVEDWEVDLKPVTAAEVRAQPQREVIFRFQHPSGVPPRGTVAVQMPDTLDVNHRTSHEQVMTLTNGEVHAEMVIGGRTAIAAKQMVGYWFNNWGEHGSLLSIEVTNGSGPIVIEIPLVPAGAIYAQARNADGTAAGGLFFGVRELKRAPGRSDNSQIDGGTDGFSGDAPRRWISGALPLGGTYQIQAWRGNAFCLSQPIKLTEANPDAAVELQFPPGRAFTGVLLDGNGKPLRDAEVRPTFKLSDESNFGLAPVFTDGSGRFQMDNMTPDQGEYSIEAGVPGLQAETVKLNFSAQPQIIALKPGRTLAGQVVERGTQRMLPDVEVRAMAANAGLPQQTTRTDAEGRFKFNTLANVQYLLSVQEGRLIENNKHMADGSTNLLLSVKLFDWSKLKSPAATKPATNVSLILADPNYRKALATFEKQAGTNAAAAPRATAGEPRESNHRINGVDPATRIKMLQSLSNDATNAPPKQFQQRLAAVLAHAAQTQPETTNLFTRVYKVEQRDLLAGLQSLGVEPWKITNSPVTSSALAGKLFAVLGVDMAAPPGKVVFYAEKGSLLFVKATKNDLDRIEEAILAINTIEPQVYIKFQFFEVPEKLAGGLLTFPGLTHGAPGTGLTGVLPPASARNLVQAIQAIPGVNILAEPQAIAMSGGEVRMMATKVTTVVTNLAFSEVPTMTVTTNYVGHWQPVLTTNYGMIGKVVPEFKRLEYGPVLEVVPQVLSGQEKIVLKATASDNKFYGYVEPHKNIFGDIKADWPHHVATNSAGEKITMPELFPVEQLSQATATATVADGETLVLFPTPVGELDARRAQWVARDEKKQGRKLMIVLVTAQITDQAGNRAQVQR